MSDQNNIEDAEGHRLRAADGTEDDTEGHRLRAADGTEDDTEGHRLIGSNLETEDDVEGHVQPPRDADTDQLRP